MYKLFLGFVGGVLFGSFVNLGLAFVFLPFLIGVGLFALRRRDYLALVLVCVGLTVGLLRVYLTPPIDPVWESKIGKEASFTALIVAEPDKRDNTTLITLKPEGSKNKILATLPPYVQYGYGDTLKINGKLERPQSFTTEAGKVFDYQKYLEKDGVFFTVYLPETELVSKDEGGFVSRLLGVKKFFTERLAKSLPEPESSLLAGLLVGEKQALGKEWNDHFRTVGLSHVVVLSGFNLSVVAENILRLTGLILPAKFALASGAAGIIIFALMVGGGATVLRASIMALIALLARATGRLYEATVALIVAGVLMLLWNPLVLVYDLGFQLSFLATLGVIHGPVLLAPYFARLTDRWGIKEVLLTTLSAQIIVLPWILYTTGNLSLVALPANLLVLPFIPLTMLFGFLTAFLAPLAFISHLLLAYILLIVKIFSALPLAAVIIKQFPLILVLVCYSAIFYFWYKKNTPAPVNSAREKDINRAG